MKIDMEDDPAEQGQHGKRDQPPASPDPSNVTQESPEAGWPPNVIRDGGESGRSER